MNTKHTLIEISHLGKEEKEKGKQLLLKIFRNILEEPQNEKYHSLNLSKVEQRLSNCSLFVNLLENAGFAKSNDNQRLIFNKSKLNDLEIVNELLLNEKSCIELLELIQEGFNMEDIKVAIKMSESNQYKNNMVNDDEKKSNHSNNALKQLMEIGFDEESSSIALSICNYDINQSLKCLINQQSLNEHYVFDSNDHQNMQKLKEINTKFIDMEVKPSRIDSSYLLNGIYIYNDTTCPLKQCQSLLRISNILKRYHLYIEQNEEENVDQNEAEIVDLSFQQLVNDGVSEKEAKVALDLSIKVNNIEIENIYLSDNYSNIHLLNDFNHLLFAHSGSTEFENIYNILISQSNDKKECEMRDCISMTRNRRNRSIQFEKLYFNNGDKKSIVKQQLIDRIHDHFFHSFDSALKLTENEKRCIMNDNHEHKINDDDDIIFDPNVYKIYNLIKSKKNAIPQLNRLNASNNKFNVEIDAKQNEKEYSFGRRYFYWKYYQNQYHEERDPVHPDSGTKRFGSPISNRDYKLGDWYIDPKYDNFKEELLSNNICIISSTSWDILIEKALHHIQTYFVRQMKCPRKESAKYYEMEYNQRISTNHLIAIMIYCNYTELQRKFTETFRYKNKNESDNEMKKRHQTYYHLGRLLREIVECFGMNGCSLLAARVMNISLYHGVNDYFTFSSLNAFIAGPLSTTTNYSVAVNFCANKGMILNINMHLGEWGMKSNEGPEALTTFNCIDCRFISDYVSEQEIFFIGGLNKFTFNTIIEATTGYNYCKYITGLKQMTYFMGNGSKGNPFLLDSIAWISSEEKQMVFRLLSHELNRYYPNHPYSHEFKSCPDYFKNILHSHCKNITHIWFHNRGDKESKFHEVLFKYDDEWIKLDLITTIFPNIDSIGYSADKKEMLFLKQSSIYNSTLHFISNNKNTKLKEIHILINSSLWKEMEIYIDSYTYAFNQHSWRIYVDHIDNIWEGMNNIETEERTRIIMIKVEDNNNREKHEVIQFAK